MSEIRAVVFDIGGTLWFQARAPSSDELHGLQARRVAPLLNRWGIHVPSLTDILQAIWEASDSDYVLAAARGSMREVPLSFLIRGALANLGIDLSEEQAEEWHRAAWVSPMSNLGMQLYPDTLDVLTALRQRGLKLGVNTNRPCTGDMFRGDLDDAGIARFFDAIVCSGDTGFVKPHPSTFEMVLSQLGVAGDEAVMVGDTCLADMRGGKALGMRTVLKLNGRYDAPACPDADHRIHDLGELLALPLFAPPDGRRSPESLTPHDDGNEDRY